MRRSLILAMTAALAGCASIPGTVPMALQVRDEPAARRIVLVYRNPTEWKMCLTPDNWPNAAGVLDQASNRAVLVAGGERFPIRDANTGYCPRCSLAVKPHEEVAAAIPYSEFALPERLYAAPKSFDFHPQAYACDAG